MTNLKPPHQSLVWGKTKKTISTMTSGIIALVVGFISAKTVLNRTWIALIPWAIIGILMIWFATSKRQGIWNGAVYGAVLTDSFMLFNYKSGSPHLTFWIFVVALAVFGFGVGAFGGWLVWKIRNRRTTTSQ